MEAASASGTLDFPGLDAAPVVLEIVDLHTHFVAGDRVTRVVNGVRLRVARGEIVGLVGETGSGKSLTASSVMHVLRPPARIVRGAILFDGKDLRVMSSRQRRAVFGREIALISQNPRSALNPLIPVGKQLVTVYAAHRPTPKAQLETYALEMLAAVGFRDPERISRSYPHQLSGGTAQRVIIAMALGTNPKIVLADEPTTGLDATIQVQVLDLLTAMIEREHAAALLITHDLAVVSNYCDRVAVMHAGRIVEDAKMNELFRRPAHPYTFSLLEAENGATSRMSVIGGPPDLSSLPSGCTYRLRCPLATARCAQSAPTRRSIGPGHFVECHHAEDLLSGTQTVLTEPS